MKTKTILILLLMMVMGCGKTKDETVKDPAILGTWRLVGFGDEQGNVREANPTEKECRECYTITFKKDKTAEGNSTVNKVQGVYDIDLENNNLLLYLGTTKAGEWIDTDGDLYADLIMCRVEPIKNYKVVKNQLFIYYKTQKEKYQHKFLSDNDSIFMLFNKK